MSSNYQEQINATDEHAAYAMQLASASVLPMVLKATVELGVFDIIHKAGSEAKLSTRQISSQIPANNNPDAPFMLDVILRLLSSHSIVTCSVVTDKDDGNVHRLYGLAPVAKYFIKNQNGGSLAPYLELIQDKFFMDNWYNLKDSVLEGVEYVEAHSVSPTKKDQRIVDILNRYVVEFNPLFMDKILEVYDGFRGVKTLVDVGGGNGSVLNMIISKYPYIKGINYDVPAVIDNAPPYRGIEHVAGDMFESVPKGDAVFIKWVLHGWDDNNFVKALKNCYIALPENGKVVMVEMVVPDCPEDTWVCKSVFQYVACTMNTIKGRKERSVRDYNRLGKQAGFSYIRIPCSAFDFAVVEFCKNV
jgi:caffeic acid 3-O-methyltransferase